MDQWQVAVEVILILAIVGFTAWLSRLSFTLSQTIDSISGTDEQFDEIRENIEVVATILNRLPELMPQFNMNTNPLQPLFEAFAKKISGEGELLTYETTRGSDGQFNGSQTWKTQDAPPSASDDQIDADA